MTPLQSNRSQLPCKSPPMPPGRSIKQGKEWPGHALGMLWACSEQVLVRGCYCSSQANSRRKTILILEIPDESVLYVLYCTVSCVQTRQVPGVEAAAELPRGAEAGRNN